MGRAIGRLITASRPVTRSATPRRRAPAAGKPVGPLHRAPSHRVSCAPGRQSTQASPREFGSRAKPALISRPIESHPVCGAPGRQVGDPRQPAFAGRERASRRRGCAMPRRSTFRRRSEGLVTSHFSSYRIFFQQKFIDAAKVCGGGLLLLLSIKKLPVVFGIPPRKIHLIIRQSIF